MSQTKGFEFKAGVKAPIANPDVSQVISDVAKAKANIGKVVTDYTAEAFYTFNKIAPWGAEISAFSLVVFLGVLIESFYNKSTATS